MYVIRPAKIEDAQDMLNIYQRYIRDTSLTFEADPLFIEAFKKRIADYSINWPWLVCVINGVIAGYAYGARYRERTGYQWCVETSVYIHDDFLRMGVAKRLYTSLVNILRLQGYRNVYAVINLPNDKSVSFHEACGFKHFATYENVGYKLGQWKDVGWWQLQINDYSPEPAPPIKFSLLPGEKILHCCK